MSKPNPSTKRGAYPCPGCGVDLGGKQGISGHAKNTPTCTSAMRFWGRVDKSGGADACWPWKGAVTSKHGYGNALWEGRYVSAHRIAWSLAIGPIPPAMCVLHKCDNRVCCNPAHYFLGTKKDNSADARAKGRYAYGERCLRNKLTEKDVLAIRAKYRRRPGGRCFISNARELAPEYGVLPQTIINAAEGRTWGHLK